MPTAIDVFSKVRGHERAEQLRAARDADLLPYFRVLESTTGAAGDWSVRKYGSRSASRAARSCSARS